MNLTIEQKEGFLYLVAAGPWSHTVMMMGLERAYLQAKRAGLWRILLDGRRTQGHMRGAEQARLGTQLAGLSRRYLAPSGQRGLVVVLLRPSQTQFRVQWKEIATKQKGLVVVDSFPTAVAQVKRQL